MPAGIARLARGLEAFEHQGLRRHRRIFDSPQGLRMREGTRALVNFSSNDYLGLANHPRLLEAAHRTLDEYGVGAGASPLVCGHLRVHEEAETRFASFAGLPRAVLFASGYAANLGILTALADRSAEIFADKLNHACLNDGALLSGAKFSRYAHADLDTLARRLAESTAEVKVVASDTVFSMDGDLADAPRLLELCERHDAWLVLDDAHGIGVLGRTGRGALEHFGLRSPRIVYMATLGKALGGYGAFVCGEPEVADWMIQRARTLIYSTALPPMAAGVAIAALDLVDSDASLLARLRANIDAFRESCALAGVPLSASSSAIQPITIGSASRALAISARLDASGFLVTAIRPPTVPEGSSRLRVCLSAAHDLRDVRALAIALAVALSP